MFECLYGEVCVSRSLLTGSRNTDGHAPGWKEVPVHDPEVQHAANHAITSIQQRSNSLLPYVLKEIVNAKAEVSSFIPFV